MRERLGDESIQHSREYERAGKKSFKSLPRYECTGTRGNESSKWPRRRRFANCDKTVERLVRITLDLRRKDTRK